MRNYSPELSQEKQTEVNQLEEQIGTNLNLDEGLAQFKPETRKIISGVITQTITECSEILGFPNLPDITLDYQWDKMEEPDSWPLRYAQTQILNYYGEVNANGKIKICPHTLLIVAQHIEKLTKVSGTENIDYTYFLSPLDRMRAITAHEAHHIWEKYHLPKKTQEENGARGDNWNTDRREYAAELFSLMYVRHRKTVGFKDWILKQLTVVQDLSHVLNMKRQREKSKL